MSEPSSSHLVACIELNSPPSSELHTGVHWALRLSDYCHPARRKLQVNTSHQFRNAFFRHRPNSIYMKLGRHFPHGWHSWCLVLFSWKLLAVADAGHSQDLKDCKAVGEWKLELLSLNNWVGSEMILRTEGLLESCVENEKWLWNFLN